MEDILDKLRNIVCSSGCYTLETLPSKSESLSVYGNDKDDLVEMNRILGKLDDKLQIGYISYFSLREALNDIQNLYKETNNLEILTVGNFLLDCIDMIQKKSDLKALLHD